jgi:hypothetical protein
MKPVKILILTLISGLALLTLCAPAQEPGKYPFEKISDRAPGRGDILFAGGSGDTAGLISEDTYAFSFLSGVATEEMSGSATVLGPPFINNPSSSLSQIGFYFRFDGGNFNTFSANSNGFVRLGAVPTGFTAENLIPSAENSPKIAPMWNQLCLSSTGRILSKTFGVPGSRKTVIEWSGVMIAPPIFGPCGGDGVFQLWLFEGTGVIQFVYWSGISPASGFGGGYSVGIQSGAATNFASVLTSSNTVSYTASSDHQSSSIASGTSYRFTPRQPSAAPTGGSVSNLTQTSLQLNWADNATNETAYVIRRTADNVNFTFAGEVPAGSSSFVDTGLFPNTQYFYLVNAVTEGGVSSDLALSATTPPMRNLSSNAGVTGLWSDPATWAQGIVPQSGDNVTIENGSNVTLDIAAAVWSLELGTTAGLTRAAGEKNVEGANGASLVYDAASAKSLAVRTNIHISPGSFLGSAAAGAVTSHQLSLGGDLINNGILDLSTNNNSAGVDMVFTGASNNTFGGSGEVTDVRNIRIDKGAAAYTLEFTMSNFSVQGSTTETPASGYLTLANGTLKISGTFEGNHRTFVPGYQLPANVGLWLNNPNYTIVGQPGSVDLRSSLRVTAGNYNVGNGIDDSLIIYPNINITIEGGTIGTAGRFSVWTPDTPFFYTQTGGTVVTCKVGQTSVDFACFDMGTGAGFITLQVLLTGGDIVIQNAASAASGPRDYRNRTTGGIYNMTGTSLVFGNENTAGPSNFAAFGDMPNVIVNTAAGGHTLTLLRPNEGPYRNNSRDVEIGPGGTFDIGDTDYFMQGNNFVNNGTLNATGPNAEFVWFGADSSPVYSGSGVSAGVMTYMEVIADQLVLDPAINNIRARKIHVAKGNVINAFKLTLGNNDAIPSEILIGDSGAPAAALDSSPVFELGTGGQSVSYLRGPNEAWTTGPEINPQRVLVDLTFNVPPPSTLFLNINGGDITVNGNLVITWGTIRTGGNKIIHNGTVVRQNGWVEGTVERIFTGPGSYTYPVGAGGFYSPATASVTSVNTVPSRLSVKAVDSTLPGLSSQVSASRFWPVVETGDLAATLSFTYADADINGNESLYRTWRSNGGPPVYINGSTANPGANTVTSASGLTELLGDWGLGIAPVSVSGRVLTSGGAPIRNAILTLTGGSLTAPRVFQTGNFGSYVFDDLRGGETYTLRIGAKRYRFAQLSWEIIPLGNITNLDFTANPQD